MPFRFPVWVGPQSSESVTWVVNRQSWDRSAGEVHAWDYPLWFKIFLMNLFNNFLGGGGTQSKIFERCAFSLGKTLVPNGSKWATWNRTLPERWGRPLWRWRKREQISHSSEQQTSTKVDPINKERQQRYHAIKHIPFVVSVTYLDSTNKERQDRSTHYHRKSLQFVTKRTNIPS